MFFTPEYSFRKLSPNCMPFSRTALLREATDVRWVRLKRSTRATAHIQENDHVSQTDSRTCCRSFPRRDGAGSDRCFRRRRMGLAQASPPRSWPWLRHRLRSAAAMAAKGATGPASCRPSSATATASSTSAPGDRNFGFDPESPVATGGRGFLFLRLSGQLRQTGKFEPISTLPRRNDRETGKKRECATIMIIFRRNRAVV